MKPRAVIAETVGRPVRLPLVGVVDLVHDVLPGPLLFLVVAILAVAEHGIRLHSMSGVWALTVVNTAVGVVAAVVSALLVRTTSGARWAGIALMCLAVLIPESYDAWQLHRFFHHVYGFVSTGGRVFSKGGGAVVSTAEVALFLAGWLVLRRRQAWTYALLLAAPVIGYVLGAQNLPWLMSRLHLSFNHAATIALWMAIGLYASVAVLTLIAALGGQRVVRPALLASVGAGALGGPAGQGVAYAGVPAGGVHELPSRAATIVVSALFGPFGAIPASMATSRATMLGVHTGRYWKAFWVTWLISFLVGIAVTIGFYALVLAAVTSSR